MKALSIRQPWAWAILHAGKDIENRDWSTKLRGTIAIHAASGMTAIEFDQAAYFMMYGGPDVSYKLLARQRDMPRGCIIGLADIVDCVNESNSPWFMGSYGFVLANVRVLPEPIPCKGALKFWDVPVEILERLTRPPIQ